MIDGPHLDDILEPGKGSLDFTEIFVDFHRFDCGETLLLALENVFAFQRLRLPEVFRMFKIVELAVLQFPIVVAEPWWRASTRLAATPIFSGALNLPWLTLRWSASSSSHTLSIDFSRSPRS